MKSSFPRMLLASVTNGKVKQTTTALKGLFYIKQQWNQSIDHGLEVSHALRFLGVVSRSDWQPVTLRAECNRLLDDIILRNRNPKPHEVKSDNDNTGGAEVYHIVEV